MLHSDGKPHRTAQLRPTNEARKFEHATTAFGEDEWNLRIPAYGAAYQAVYAATDEIMSAESERFWKATVAENALAKPET